MKKYLVLTLISLPVLCYCQRLHVNLSGGFAGYQGDLQGRNITLDQTKGAFGAGLTYNLTGHLSLRTGLVTGSIEADDKNNKPDLQIRNLHFKSKITEGNLLAEYNLFDLKNRKFTPYVFAGVGVYHFDPYTYDTTGKKHFLQPLSTEGQGLALYPDRKPYKRTQFTIPFGGGLKYRLTDNVVLGYEIGLRKLFTDYLDDVSTTYVDQHALQLEKGAKAVEMSYRGGELKTGSPVYPAAGTMRGGAEQKDWYYLQGISVSIGLRGRNDGGWRGRGNNIGCPAGVL